MAKVLLDFQFCNCLPRCPKGKCGGHYAIGSPPVSSENFSEMAHGSGYSWYKVPKVITPEQAKIQRTRPRKDLSRFIWKIPYELQIGNICLLNRSKFPIATHKNYHGFQISIHIDRDVLFFILIPVSSRRISHRLGIGQVGRLLSAACCQLEKQIISTK